jgi:hypothetical protein
MLNSTARNFANITNSEAMLCRFTEYGNAVKRIQGLLEDFDKSKGCADDEVEMPKACGARLPAGAARSVAKPHQVSGALRRPPTKKGLA